MPAYKSLHNKWKIMDLATRISLLLILCGNVHAKDWNPTIIAQGNNETIYIDMPKRDGETHLEISFYGYTSNQHFTNILLYFRMNGQKWHTSINSNYTGRIESVVNSNGQLSFLLLNVMFNDSGNYTIKEKSDVKETTCVLVTSRIYKAKLWEPMIFSFIVHENTTSFIRVENHMSKLSEPVVMYNATNDICTYIDFISMEKKNIENCVLSNGEFSYTIAEIGWLHKGSYFAWDEKGRLLDSIFLDIQGNNMTGSVETRLPLHIEKLNPLLFVVLVIGGIIGGIIIAFLAYLLHKVRIRFLVERISKIDTSIKRNKDDVEEIVQKDSSLGGYLTVISSERGKFKTAIELDFVQGNEAPLFEQTVVIAKNELQHSLRLDSVKDNDALDGYLNPINSCSVEFDEFMNPIPSCSVEFEEYVSPITSSPVNSGFGITRQSCSSEFDEYIHPVSSCAEELYEDISTSSSPHLKF